MPIASAQFASSPCSISVTASSSLAQTDEDLTAAFSRIKDIDMATEMTTYANQQVLQQAGTSVLAQANDIPQQVLQLLQ